MPKKQNTKSLQSPIIHSTPHGPAHGEDLKFYHEAVFAWKAQEYIRHKRGPMWYFGAVMSVILLVLSSLVAHNWTMTVAVISFASVYYYLHIHQHPREVEVVISQMGIKVGTMVFPYTHIQSFWIIYQPPFVKTLTIRVDKKFYSDVVIQLGNQDPVPVRQFLCTQVPELEGKNEQFADTLLRLLKL